MSGVGSAAAGAEVHTVEQVLGVVKPLITCEHHRQLCSALKCCVLTVMVACATQPLNPAYSFCVLGGELL